MYSKTSVAVLFSIAVATSAQSTTPKSTTAQPTGPITWVLIPQHDHLPGGEKMPLVGSVVGVESSRTTLYVQCVPGTPETICGMPTDGMTVTQGPKTAIIATKLPAWGPGDDEYKGIMVDYGWDCSIDDAVAECVYHATASTTGSVAPSVLSDFNALATASTSTLQLKGTDLADSEFNVTITAGAEKLSQTGQTELTGSESGSPTESGATSPSKTPGSAASLKIGGSVIGCAIAAVLML
ncbi:hypothetical protein BU23DRAFT_552140 [Bimuria novae-zelandiae CBS 107.79]|uniref:Uncharacterized protein n=1 Tax=Bimuria novae-zelandiae CBS 107.79 TaxID=1447943 RepID=A0A6A5VGU2_9PLEO|nr:hypothetical protein BU23DRAFT_552140 [Bimuria novae-zelandiae CBS 107.79]